MKKLIVSFLLVLFFSACATHSHTFGEGPSTGLTEEKGNTMHYMDLFH